MLGVRTTTMMTTNFRRLRIAITVLPMASMLASSSANTLSHLPAAIPKERETLSVRLRLSCAMKNTFPRSPPKAARTCAERITRTFGGQQMSGLDRFSALSS
jgi:hypothetical protein